MIKYITGDALVPIVTDGLRITPHVCNDIGAWGSGFVTAISARWPQPEEAYKHWYNGIKSQYTVFTKTFTLGEIQTVIIDPTLFIVNMIAQSGIEYKGRGDPPLRYEALTKCLRDVCLTAYLNNTVKDTHVSFHMPRIGCGLAGGEWEAVEAIINDVICTQGFDVYVYDLP